MIKNFIPELSGFREPTEREKLLFNTYIEKHCEHSDIIKEQLNSCIVQEINGKGELQILIEKGKSKIPTRLDSDNISYITGSIIHNSSEVSFSLNILSGYIIGLTSNKYKGINRMHPDEIKKIILDGGTTSLLNTYNIPYEFRDPTKNEKKVFDLFMKKKPLGYKEIAEQLKNCNVRQIDKDGSIEIQLQGNKKKAAQTQRIPVEANLYIGEHNIINIMLHVVDGYVNELEVCRTDLCGKNLINGLSDKDIGNLDILT